MRWVEVCRDTGPVVPAKVVWQAKRLLLLDNGESQRSAAEGRGLGEQKGDVSMDINLIIRRFRQFYGHLNFNDARYLEDEYYYKYNRGREMRDWLGPEALDDLIQKEDWAEVSQRVVQSFAFPSGPLARWDEYQWVVELDDAEQRAFALALERFLHGDDPFLGRLDQFVQAVTEIYRVFRESDPAHKKRYRGKNLTWPFVSYFHFMMWPEEYVFVKPTPLKKAAKLVGFDLHYHSQPNGETYQRVQEFYKALWPEAQQHGARNMIDVQTLIHVAGEGFGVPEGGWDEEVGMRNGGTETTVACVSELLSYKSQIVLQGAPGTGKTHLALLVTAHKLGVKGNSHQELRRALRPYQLSTLLDASEGLIETPDAIAAKVREDGHGLWDIVQLHPTYSYEDFVRGMVAEPTPDGHNVTFRAVNRVFGLLAAVATELAKDDVPLPVVLIIDEINRGDLSKVLGELIYALEYRDETVLTPYAVDGKPGLTLPAKNLYLIGTMNTADRSIALVDYVIRRRFAFVQLGPRREVIADYYGNKALGEKALDLFDKVRQQFGLQFNQVYTEEDMAVGHTYFLAENSGELAAKLAFGVAPLLREYIKEGILEKDIELDLDGQKVNLSSGDQFELMDTLEKWIGRDG